MLWLMAMMLTGQAIDNLPADCSQAMTTPEINACGALDLRREEQRMEEYLQAAYRRAADSGTQEAAWLRASQSAWKAYADIACGAVYEQWSDGTIRGVMYLGCMVNLTRERTHVVWRGFLTYPDSTPPVLPEPRRPLSESPVR